MRKVKLWTELSTLCPDDPPWLQEWTSSTITSETWALPQDRAQALAKAAKCMLQREYADKEKELRRAYVKGLRRRLDTERRRTMQEVYARG